MARVSRRVLALCKRNEVRTTSESVDLRSARVALISMLRALREKVHVPDLQRVDGHDEHDRTGDRI